MTPVEVAASYDQIAPVWAGPDFPRNNGILQHQRAIQFVSARGLALDVGCGGSGRFIELLVESGFVPEGLDLSTEMIRLARLRHPSVTFHHADICTWQSAVKYSFITAWDSIWHVPLADQTTVLAKLCAALEPGGVLIFTAGGLSSAHETRDSAMGVPMYHATPGLPAIVHTLHDSNCICRHLEFDQ